MVIIVMILQTKKNVKSVIVFAILVNIIKIIVHLVIVILNTLLFATNVMGKIEKVLIVNVERDL